MIKKEIQIPPVIPKLEALQRRIPANYPKRTRIVESLRRYQSGYSGEASIDYHLNFLPEKESFVLHDLRLLDDKDTHFQLDITIITTAFILLLSVKNHAGKLTIDPIHHQMIQSYNGKETGYNDPVLQTDKHEQKIRTWLRMHGFPSIPIVSLVVFSNESAIIELTKNIPRYQQMIIRPAAIQTKFNSISQSKNMPVYTLEDCKKLSERLIESHHPADQNVLELFNIRKLEIIPGAHCPKCSGIPMTYYRGWWHCHICFYKCKDAHIYTLKDHVLLYENKITTSEYCRFLRNDSPSIARYHLHNLNLKYTGKYKDRVYYLPTPQEFDEIIKRFNT